MTLIVAIRCTSGVVVCADSQETVDDYYRVSVDKIKPRDCVNYDLVVGGSGDLGALIDGQARAIEENVRQWPGGMLEQDCRIWLEAALASYMDDQIRRYPAKPKEKILRFVICVRDKISTSIYLWKTEANIVEPVDDYVLLGWKEQLYQREAGSLYREGLTRSRATLLGLRLLSLGKATSNYIGDPFQVIAVERERTDTDSPDIIEVWQKRIKKANDALNKVIILTSDFSVSDEVLEGALKGFGEEIFGLRGEVRQHTLEIQSAIHAHTAVNVTLEVNDPDKS